ncbi:MAG: hypothetical protein GY856_20205 [bacterium]|nr:hypothetical protein [bacterium]
MNPIDPELLVQGLSYVQFRERVTRNAETFAEVYEHPAFTPADLELLRRLPPLTVVAIGEDWCPDVFHTLPTWARVAEALDGWSLRIFERDQHPTLMDCFLYREKARRIPVYAFYDQRGSLQVWWSGRGAEAQKAIDGWLAGRAFAELDPEGRTAISRQLQAGYRTSFRRANFEELLALLGAFFHLDRDAG